MFLKGSRLFQRFQPFIPYGILTFLVAATYLNTLGHGFVWDDNIFVAHRSSAYLNFDLSTIFFTLSTNGLEYLPVRDVSYALDFALWGKNPTGFHFSNIILFWLNVLMIYLFTDRLIQQCHKHFDSDMPSRTIAFCTAALFAVHPLHGEVVNFITARNALLCGVFFFTSCLAYLLYLTTSNVWNRVWYISAFICFTLAVFSKATGIILPLILMILTYVFRRPKQISGWLSLLPFMIMSAACFFFFKQVAMVNQVIEKHHSAETAITIIAKVVTAFKITVFYLYKMLIPFSYSVDYDIEQFGRGLSASQTAGILTLLILLICLAVSARKTRHRRGFLLFCAVWYMVSLLPVLHLFPTHPVVADRYAFLPSYPVFLLLASSCATVSRRFPTVQVMLGAIVLIALAYSSILHNRIWKSDKSLWEYTTRTAPHSVVAHINLARLYFIDEHEYGKGLELAKKVQQLNPLDTNYDVFQGVLQMRGGNLHSAIADFNRALEKNSQHMETLVNLGTAYQLLGEREMALGCLRRAVNSTEPSTPGDLRETATEMLRELNAPRP